MTNCTGPNAPSNKTILEHLEKEPKTEKINLNIVNHSKDVFINLKEFMINKNYKTLNLEIEEEGNSTHSPQYYEFPQEYTVTLTNDSTVTTDLKSTDIYYEPGEKDMYTPSSLHSDVIFHNDGNIEIIEKNIGFSTELKKNVIENTNMEIDGGSGTVIRYVESSPETEEVTKYFRLTKDGKVDQSSNYEHGTAMEKINIGNSSLSVFYAIEDHLKQSK